MRETTVENYLRVRVERRGGTCEKFVSPGKNSVPDRIINDRPGHIDYAETKAPKKGATEAQKRDHARRRARGFRVFVINTKWLVDHYMDNYYGR